jgi:TRAP-type C4-dicarboxylate transport system permease small subunit
VTDIPVAHTFIAPAEPAWLVRLSELSSLLNKMAAFMAAVALLGMVALILLEIVLRLFGYSTYMTDVLVGYGVASITFLAMAWALESSAMIRVSLVRRNVGSQAKIALDIFAALSTLFATGLFVIYGWRSMIRNFNSGALSQHYVQIPLWIPDAIFVIGMALVALQLIVRLLRSFAVGVVEEPELEL